MIPLIAQLFPNLETYETALNKIIILTFFSYYEECLEYFSSIDVISLIDIVINQSEEKDEFIDCFILMANITKRTENQKMIMETPELQSLITYSFERVFLKIYVGNIICDRNSSHACKSLFEPRFFNENHY